MATFTKFEKFARDLMLKVHNLETDTLKVVLSNTAIDSEANDTLSDITQISNGNGYTTGGTTLGTNAIAETSAGSGTWKLTGDDVVFTASSGSIGPFRYVVLYNDTATNDELIGYLDYGSSITVTAGNTFTVDSDSDGFIQVT